MGKNIFVNATAATEGGILTILKQFLSSVEQYGSTEDIYYIFTSIEFETESNNIKIISGIKGKKKIARLIWDIKGMKSWSIMHDIVPNLIISLQNTGVRFGSVPQLVYIHQALPYSKESKWNLYKKDEIKYWTYKYIYKLWISLTVKERANIVVQTKWMKEALVSDGFDKENIMIAFPTINDIVRNDIKPTDFSFKYLFYPAADYKYKNHKIIIEAIKIIKKNNLKFKIVLTLDKTSKVYNLVSEAGLCEHFVFIGQVPYNEMLSLYKGCQAILFPSYVETVGLPLIEGSTFGKKILVSDCEYSREILYDYDLATFIAFDSVQGWKEGINDSLHNYKEIPNDARKKNGWKDIFNLIDIISN